MVLVSTGCAPKRVDYNQKSSQLTLNMGKGDVTQILGSPRRTDVNKDRERWIYWNPVLIGFTVMDNESLATDRLVVTFENGKVTRWGQQTFTDDAMEMSQKNMQAIIEATKKQ
ncbi:TPA: outer membrane protein assembly factor BamE [Klebsiella oxytoca]